MKTFGVVSSVEARTLGSELLADAAIAATSLQVDFVADFDEAGGQLVLNGNTLVYTTVDADTNTISLASPLIVAASADDPVVAIEAGQPGIEWLAHTTIDEGDTVAAKIPTSLIAYFPEGTYDEPVSVRLVLDGDSYEVASQPTRDATLDGAAVWNPYVSRRMTAATIPPGTWVTPSAWAEEVFQGLTVTTTGATVLTAGLYDIKAQPAYVTNGSGFRYARIMVNGMQVGYLGVNSDASGTTFVPVFATVFLNEGDVVTVETQQTSGMDLALSTGSGRCPVSMYRVSV